MYTKHDNVIFFEIPRPLERSMTVPVTADKLLTKYTGRK